MPTATKKRGSQSKSNLKRNEAREKKRDTEVREIWFNPHATEMRESRMGFCNCECQLLRDERVQQELQRIAKVYSQVDTAVEEGEEDEEETQSKGCCGGSKSKKSKVKSSESEPKSDKAPSKNKNAKKGKSKDERDKSKDKKEKSKDKKEKSKDKKEKSKDKKEKSKDKKEKEKDKTKDKKNSIAARKGSVVKVGSQSIVFYRNCRFKTREEAKRYRELKSIYTTRPRARPSSASTKEKKKDKKSKRKEQSDMEKCPSSSSEESTNAREENQANKHKSRKDTEKSSSRRPRPRPTSSNSDYPEESASRQHKRDESKSKQKKKKSGGGCFGRRTKSKDDNDAYRPAQKSSTASAASNGRSMLPPECPFTPEELELLETLRATYARDAANKNRQRHAGAEPDKADTGCCGSKKKKRTPTEDESNYSLHSQYTHDSFSHHDCRCAENYSTTFKQKYTTCESTSEIFTSNLQSCDAQSCRADKVQYDDHANGTVAARYAAEKEKCAAILLPLRSESAVLTEELGNKVNTAQTQTDYRSGQPKSKDSKSVKEPSLQDSNTDTACTCLRYLKMRNKRGTHAETSAEKTNDRPCCENEACTMQKPKHTPTEKGTNEAAGTLIETEMEKQAHNETELLSAHVEKVASKISMQNETTEQFIESEQCKRLSSEKECSCEDAQKVLSKTSHTSVLSRRENGSNTDLKGPNKSNKSIQTELIEKETTKTSTSCCPIVKKSKPKKSDDRESMRSNSKNQIGALHKTELEIDNPQILDKDQQKLCQTSSFCTFVKAEPENELSVHIMEMLSKSNDFRRPSTVEIAEANQRPPSKLSIPSCCAIRKEVSPEKLDNTTKEIMAYGSDESRASNNNNFENQPLTTGRKNNMQQEQTNESFSCCAIVEKKSSKVSPREEFTVTESEQGIGTAPSKNPKKCWPIGRKDRSEKSDIVVRRRSTQKGKDNDENVESKELPPCCRNGKEFQKQVDSKETQTQFEPAQTEMNEIPGKPGACCTIDMKNKKELELSKIKPPSSGGPDVKKKSFKTTAAPCCSEVSETKLSDVKGKDLKNLTSKKSSCCPIAYYSTVNTEKSKELKVYEKKPANIEGRDLKMASFKAMSAQQSLPHRNTTKEPKQFETKFTKKEGDLKKAPSKTNSCCTSSAPCCPIDMFPGDSEIKTFDGKETTEEEKAQQGFESAEKPKKAMQKSTEEHVNKKPTSCCPIGIRHKSKNLQYFEKRSSNDKMPDKLEDKRTRMSREKKENYRESTTFDFPDDIEKVPLSLGKGASSIVSTESPRDAHKESFIAKRLENFKQKPLKTSLCCPILKNKRTLCCPIGVKSKIKDITPTERKVESLERKSSEMSTLQPTMKGMPHFEEEQEDKYKTSEGSKGVIDRKEYKKDTTKSMMETKPKTWNRTGSANVQPTGPLETLEQESSKMSPRFEEEEAKHKTSEGSKDIIDNEEYRKDISKSLKEIKPKTWNRTGSANVQPTGPLETLEQKSLKMSPRFEEEQAKHKTSEGSKDIIVNEEYRKDISKSLKETKPKTWNRTGSANVQPTGPLETLEQKSSKMSPRFEEEQAKHKTSEGSKVIIDKEEYRKDISKSFKEIKPKTWNRTGPRRELQKIPKRQPDKTFGAPNKITPKKSKRRSKNKENNHDTYKKKPSSLSYCEALYSDLENIFMQRYQRQDILAHTNDFKAIYFTRKARKTTKRNTQQESQTNGKAAKASKDRTNKEIKQEGTNETTPNLRYKSYRKEKPKKKIEKINKKENLKSAKPPPPFAPCYATSDSQIKQAYVPEYVLGQTQNQMAGVSISPFRQIKYTVILSSNAKKKCYKDPNKAPDINYFYGHGLDCQN